MKFDHTMKLEDIPARFRGAFVKWKAYHKKPLSEVFWDKVDKRGPNECWPFLGGSVANRKFCYGLFYWRGHNKFKQSVAHRIAWLVTHGEIPNNLWVLHKCDNPPCCNPAHLFLGTHQDNMADCKNKGRNHHPIGELSPSHILTESQVLQIRSLRGTASYRELGERFGVSKPAIQGIMNRRKWKHI